MTCKEAGDDPAHQKRPSPHPGPRCFTCHQGKRRADKIRGRQTSATRLYGLSVDDLLALMAAAPRNRQGKPVCPICGRVVAAVRNPAIDHNHALGPTREAVRGLPCGTCNQFIGHIKDNPVAFLRGALYLIYPPAWDVLGTKPLNLHEG